MLRRESCLAIGKERHGASNLVALEAGRNGETRVLADPSAIGNSAVSRISRYPPSRGAWQCCEFLPCGSSKVADSELPDTTGSYLERLSQAVTPPVRHGMPRSIPSGPSGQRLRSQKLRYGHISMMAAVNVLDCVMACLLGDSPSIHVMAVAQRLHASSPPVVQ